MRTHVNFTPVNKIEAVYGRSHVKAKVETLAQHPCLRAAFNTLPLIYSGAYSLRAYARENYPTVEIHPYKVRSNTL